MRGLCKEEDYAFLGKSENICKDQASGSKEDEWSARREARVRISSTVLGIHNVDIWIYTEHV